MLTQLTWVQSAYYEANGGNPGSLQQDLDALKAAIDNSTHWETKSRAAGYLEIGPKAGSGTPNLRALFTGHPSSSTFGWLHGTLSSRIPIYVAITPDGGTLGAWDSAEPWGQGVRWSGYYSVAVTNAGEAGRPKDVYIIESSESLMVAFRCEDLLNGREHHKVVILGAIFEPQIGKAEADGRIYGLITNGAAAGLNSDFINSSSLFMTSNGDNDAEKVMCFDPSTPANKKILMKNARIQQTWSGAVNMMTQDDKKWTMPLLYSICTLAGQAAETVRGIGSLRQIYAVPSKWNNRFVFVENENDVGYCFEPTDGNQYSTIGGTLGFMNEVA